MVLDGHRRDWEDLGELDPFWAILTTQRGKFGGWNLEEFFATGRAEMKAVMANALDLGYPHGRMRALDFGCGVGRLTQALSEYFDESWGIDIAEAMISKARLRNSARQNCKFMVYNGENLSVFEDNFFDLVYTSLVLQHIPSTSLVLSYIAEFIRVLRKNGLLIFQLPTHLPLRFKLQLHRRLYTVLRLIGIKKEFLYRKAGFYPIRLTSVSSESVLRVVRDCAGRVLKVEPDTRCGSLIESRTYYATK